MLRAVATGNPAWLPFKYENRTLRDDAWLSAAEDLKWKNEQSLKAAEQENFHQLGLMLADIRYIALAGVDIQPGRLNDFLSGLPSRQGEPKPAQNPITARPLKEGESVSDWLTGRL